MANTIDVDMKSKCWGCLRQLDEGPVMRPNGSPQLLCNRCAKSGRHGNLASMVKQFAWNICMICEDCIPDRYFVCQQRKSGIRQGHAMCSQCLLDWTHSTCGTLWCPMCRGRMAHKVKTNHTMVVIPDKPSRPVTERVVSRPPTPVPKGILGVRMTTDWPFKEVKVCWMNGQQQNCWIKYEDMKDGALKRKAMLLLEEKYGS